MKQQPPQAPPAGFDPGLDTDLAELAAGAITLRHARDILAADLLLGLPARPGDGDGAPTPRRVLTDPVSGTPLQLDPAQYRLSASLRRWILYRDETCRFPGCTRRAEHSDIDHTRARERGGLTTEANLAVLCRKHHRLTHNSRCRVEQIGNGVLRWASPSGREYVTTPSRIQYGLPGPPPAPHPAPQPPDRFADAPPF